MSLYVYAGSDREKSRGAMNKALLSMGGEQVRITDAHSVSDLQAALAGGGLFGGKRTVVLDGVLASDELQKVILSALPVLKSSGDSFFMLEGKIDAATKKMLGKYAETVEVCDKPGAKKNDSIFKMADALRAGDKKTLWVEYQGALARGDAPEAIHGVLFWGVKQMLLQSRGVDAARAARFVAELAELPHTARRAGFDLEYALEHFILAVNKA